MLTAGQKAPDFELADKEGKTHRLSDFKGKVALYFYPKDSTPGCTTQACNLRDNYARLKNEDITIVGISSDDEKSHEKFISQYSLPFTLLSDSKKEVVNRYGVYGEKTFMGKIGLGIKRTTFLIDNGHVLAIISKVDVADHAQQIISGFADR